MQTFYSNPPKIERAERLEKELSLSKQRQLVLEDEIKQISEDLREARSSHTAERRHIDSLLEKIRRLESRHIERESEIKHLLLSKSIKNEEEDQIEFWKSVVDKKNSEIERFKFEMDAILENVRKLQKKNAHK